MTLKISAKLSLPDDAARWTFGFLAIKEAGKTYDACVLAEEMVKNNIPIVAIDGMGIWWGLRVGINGHQGLPVVIFGGEHKDISIPSVVGRDGHPVVDENRLRHLVLAMLQSRISAVLDTTEFSKKQQRRIVTVFVEELYQKNQKFGVRHVFLEETDMWCPQRMSPDVAPTVGAVEDLVRRGGNFNLGCTLISQRPAVVNKDILTQINTLVALRILADADKKVVKTWVESVAHPDDPRITKWYDSLRELANGEAWVWHPETDLFKRVQFRERETLHASREYYRLPKWEQENVKPVDAEAFVQKFKGLFEPKKVEPPKPMKQEPIPEMPRITRDPTPLSAPKALTVERHQEQGLGPEFQALHNKIEDEMDAIGEEPRPLKRDVGSFVMRITQLVSDSLEGKIIYIIKKHGGKRQYEIIDIASQTYGWPLFQSDVSNALKKLVDSGALFTRGSPKNKIYDFPESNRVEEVPA